MNRIWKRILFVLVLVLIAIQFFSINKENPEFEPSSDFIVMTNPPEEVQSILQSTCYDCHSNKTEYPWYTSVAPVSWWISHHIEEGREHLNFSNWGKYEAKRQDHKLEEVIEMVETGEMPLDSYTWAHEDARLTEEQRKMLIDWAEELRKTIVQ